MPILTAVNAYVGLGAALKFLSLAVNPWALISGIVCGVVEAILFVGGALLENGKALGIPFFKTKSTIKTFEKQLVGVKKLCNYLTRTEYTDALRSIQNDELPHYQNFKNILLVFRQDIKNKSDKLEKIHSPSRFRNAVKGFFGLVDCGLMGFTGFIAGQGIIETLMLTSLIVPPWSTIFCACMAFVMLGAFLCLRANTISHNIDKIAGDPKRLRDNQKSFLSRKFPQDEKESVSLTSMNTADIIGHPALSDSAPHLTINTSTTADGLAKTLHPTRSTVNLVLVEEEKDAKTPHSPPSPAYSSVGGVLPVPAILQTSTFTESESALSATPY